MRPLRQQVGWRQSASLTGVCQPQHALCAAAAAAVPALAPLPCPTQAGIAGVELMDVGPRVPVAPHNITGGGSADWVPWCVGRLAFHLWLAGAQC